MITIREPFYNYFKYDPGRKVTSIYIHKKGCPVGAAYDQRICISGHYFIMGNNLLISSSDGLRPYSQISNDSTEVAILAFSSPYHFARPVLA